MLLGVYHGHGGKHGGMQADVPVQKELIWFKTNRSLVEWKGQREKLKESGILKPEWKNTKEKSACSNMFPFQRAFGGIPGLENWKTSSLSFVI